MDEATQKNVSNFYESKNGVVEPTCEQFHRWKLDGNEVKKFRCDNARENKKVGQKVRFKRMEIERGF